MPPKSSWAPLSAEQLAQRKIVNIHAETVADTASTDIPGHYGEARRKMKCPEPQPRWLI
jgi:hypothetical protein